MKGWDRRAEQKQSFHLLLRLPVELVNITGDVILKIAVVEVLNAMAVVGSFSRTALLEHCPQKRSPRENRRAACTRLGGDGGKQVRR